MKRLILALILLASTISFIGCGGKTIVYYTPYITPIKGEPTGVINLTDPLKVRISGVTTNCVLNGFAVNVENGSSLDATLLLTVEVPGIPKTDMETGIIYDSALEDYIHWVSLSTPQEINIPPNSILTIPYGITIPNKKDILTQWEIDIKIAAYHGFLSTAASQRILVTMEH